MGLITQGYVSRGLSKDFRNRFLQKYKLKSYVDPRKPTFFFGIYNQTDLQTINRHQSLAVLIWGGNDVLRALGQQGNFRNILGKSNVKHLAISPDIKKDIEKMKYKPYPIRFSLLNFNEFSPRPLGKYIYIYTNPKFPDRYGQKFYNSVRKKFPEIKFIVANFNTYTRSELLRIYHSCFLGLRLTSHDGNANTVQELGLCGIRCVHNSDLPNAIHWSNEKDIINAINEERQKIGVVQDNVAEEMKKYLTSDKGWLNVSHYKWSKKNNRSKESDEEFESSEDSNPSSDYEEPTPAPAPKKKAPPKEVKKLRSRQVVTVQETQQPLYITPDDGPKKPVVTIRKPKQPVPVQPVQPENPAVQAFLVPQNLPAINKDPFSVTIIMNVYKENEQYLSQAIRSYLSQRDVKIQLIISTLVGDPCIKYINKHYKNRPEITFSLCTPEEHPGRGHLGIYYQLNKATRLIKNRWFAYASSNDVAVHSKLHSEIRLCLKNHKQICYSSFYITDQNLKHPKLVKFHPYSFHKHLNRNFVNDCALIETELLREFLPFRSDKYRNHAYWDLWLRVYEKYGDVFIYNSKPSFYYRTHSGAIHLQTKNDKLRKKENERFRALMLDAHL